MRRSRLKKWSKIGNADPRSKIKVTSVTKFTNSGEVGLTFPENFMQIVKIVFEKRLFEEMV